MRKILLLHKQILFLLVIDLFIVSCNNKHEVITDSFENGKPKVVNEYSLNGLDSNLIGKTLYYENGKIKMISRYSNAKIKNGKWKYYYPNGNLWSECEYKNDLKQGLSSVFYENNQLHYKGLYKNDIQIGKWQFFDDKGKLLKEENY